MPYRKNRLYEKRDRIGSYIQRAESVERVESQEEGEELNSDYDLPREKMKDVRVSPSDRRRGKKFLRSPGGANPGTGGANPG